MYLGLDCRKPRIPQDDVSVAQSCQEEAHLSLCRSCLYFQISVKLDGPQDVWRAVDIDDFPRFGQSFKGNAGFSGVCFVDEIFSCSCIEECGGLGPLAQSVNENFY
jgi:hypothetical protein